MVAFNFKASTPKLTKCIALDSVTCLLSGIFFGTCADLLKLLELN